MSLHATDIASLESSLLGVLLGADSTREGAVALLHEMAPALDDMPAALAVRDRDGLTLHVLAEQGHPCTWPTRLEPQFALGAQPGVDAGTSVMVVPLRASGRVVGALLLGDARRAVPLVRSEEMERLFATAASVLHLLVSRMDDEVRRRAAGLRSIDVIVDALAHQMANPLTGASAIAQLLAEELQDEGHRAAVGQIRHELTRAFAVLGDILDFQRDTHAHDGILDLNAVADRILRFRGYAIREQGITLSVETSAQFLPVRVDARGLEHALLIALRFAEARSHGTVNRHVSVRVAELPNAEVAIHITDSGAGDIPPVLPACFDMPFRYDATRALAGEPPDLGFVDSVLRGCGGRLLISGSKTDGTTLTLVLPRAFTNTSQTGRTA